jgi:hypothetical protein
MISVYRVYRALRDLANKEQKGFVTPVAFNSFAGMAQMNVYNELFRELSDERKARNRGEGRGRFLEGRTIKMEDVSMYIDTYTFQEGANMFKKPEDLSKIISIEAGTSVAEGGRVGVSSDRESTNRCEIVYDMEKVNLLLNSNLSTPTEEFPVAIVHDEIEVFPTNLNNIKIIYYKLPSSFNFRGQTTPLSPSYAYEQSGNDPSQHVFDAEGSLDFMLPPEMFPEIVYEMSKLIGLRLRDQDLLSYGKQEEAAS